MQQMVHVFTTDPWLTPFQLLRTLIRVTGGLLIIRGSWLPLWQTALVIGLVFSVPQNIGHLMPNPMILLNSVRISHLIVTWLLYPKINVRKS